MDELVLSVSDFVALTNATLEYAYPNVTIAGELTNYRVSKNRWVYFDLKDDSSSVKFFGTVYQLPGPLEEGMTLKVKGTPRLHNQFGFSVNILAIQPIGEGTILRAANLLQAKLEAEGLFAVERKRLIPYPPRKIGLIASSESAAYSDFLKILADRWGGVEVLLADVQVQGEPAVSQIARAIESFNQMANPPEVLVLTRGGGSAEDLAAFSSGQVTRAVAGSRIPTLVAVGHERDISLAELAADIRASTPSNAAELLVPDRKAEAARTDLQSATMAKYIQAILSQAEADLDDSKSILGDRLKTILQDAQHGLSGKKVLLQALDPQLALRRGYGLISTGGSAVKSISQLRAGLKIELRLRDGIAVAEITSTAPGA